MIRMTMPDVPTLMNRVAMNTTGDTPASITVDALGRTIKAVERTREESETSITEITTKSRYDILGNLLEVTDALNRSAFRYTYSLIPKTAPLRIDSIDAGLRQVIVDAVGQEVERRDGKGSLILQNYDQLLRPTHYWAQDNEQNIVKLRQKLIYGDNSSLTEQEQEDGNFKGQLYRHYDEAGRITIGGYDFKGNPLETTRRVLSDEKLLSVYVDAASSDWEVVPFQIDWREPADSFLNPTQYTTITTYDALNRATSVTYPEDVEGNRSILMPTYNRAGTLKSVTLDGKSYVEQIAYNAKGQRTLIAYGNNRMTRFTYDNQTFRLKRLRTEKFSEPDTHKYIPDGAPMQDFAYNYDLAGNILKIKDRTPGSGVPATPDQLDRNFKYDPLYRLRSATGRECDTLPQDKPWENEFKCDDVTSTRRYTRTFDYDKMGNMQLMHHKGTGNNSVPFDRKFEIKTELVNNQTRKKNNRLERVTFGGTVYEYSYDDNGNMTQEGESRHFEWNHSDQLKAFRTQTENSEPSLHAQYLYDATGQRVMKLVRKQGGKLEARVYIGEIFEYYRWGIQTNNSKENNTLHVMDDQQRIALVRRGQAHPDDRGPDIQFHIGDHLGSSNLVIGDNGSFINREEYYPYGETSFGGFGKKRYRFTGKERDEESGLNYHRMRYYSNVMCRWISTDPLGIEAGVNQYRYSSNNPINRVDASGENDEDALAIKGIMKAEGLSSKQKKIAKSLIQLLARELDPIDQDEIRRALLATNKNVIVKKAMDVPAPERLLKLKSRQLAQALLPEDASENQIKNTTKVARKFLGDKITYRELEKKLIPFKNVLKKVKGLSLVIAVAAGTSTFLGSEETANATESSPVLSGNDKASSIDFFLKVESNVANKFLNQEAKRRGVDQQSIGEFIAEFTPITVSNTIAVEFIEFREQVEIRKKYFITKLKSRGFEITDKEEKDISNQVENVWRKEYRNIF
jgi:RHS repeat-associated protein